MVVAAAAQPFVGVILYFAIMPVKVAKTDVIKT
jgi:hypothetical protein